MFGSLVVFELGGVARLADDLPRSPGPTSTRSPSGRKGRSWWSRPPVDALLHVVVMLFP
jgi:hypothetical protein